MFNIMKNNKKRTADPLHKFQLQKSLARFSRAHQPLSFERRIEEKNSHLLAGKGVLCIYNVKNVLCDENV